MSHIKIDASNNRVLRTISNRLDLGPNGPDVIARLAMLLVFIVVVLLFSGRFWESSSSNWLFVLFPILFVGQFVWLITRSLRSAKKDLDEGWRD